MLTKISIETIENDLMQAEKNYRRRMLDLVDEGMQEPTWDGKRYHAPCDHYVFDGVSYAAGEFLHSPEERLTDDQLNQKGFKTSGKIKLTISTSAKERFDNIITQFGGSVGFGKSWEKDGIEQCNAYIEGRWTLLNRIRKLVPESGRELVEAGTAETGATWKTTTGKLMQNKLWIGPTGVESAENINEDILRKVLEWYLDDTPKKKPVRLEVGYCYKSFIVI